MALLGPLMPDYADGVAAGGGGGGDVTPPTITIVSPTPGVDPGDPGGFPLSASAARATPIVLQVTDAGGLATIAIAQVFRNAAAVIVGMATVFWRGAFVAPYTGTAEVITNGFELTVSYVGGWPTASSIEFDIMPVDDGGNLGSA